MAPQPWRNSQTGLLEGISKDFPNSFLWLLFVSGELEQTQVRVPGQQVDRTCWMCTVGQTLGSNRKRKPSACSSACTSRLGRRTVASALCPGLIINRTSCTLKSVPVWMRMYHHHHRSGSLEAEPEVGILVSVIWGESVLRSVTGEIQVRRLPLLSSCLALTDEFRRETTYIVEMRH